MQRTQSCLLFSSRHLHRVLTFKEKMVFNLRIEPLPNWPREMTVWLIVHQRMRELHMNLFLSWIFKRGILLTRLIRTTKSCCWFFFFGFLPFAMGLGGDCVPHDGVVLPPCCCLPAGGCLAEWAVAFVCEPPFCPTGVFSRCFCVRCPLPSAGLLRA